MRLSLLWSVVLLFGAVAAPAQDPVISEFLADNTGGFVDQDGDSSDWIELSNPGSSPVNLGGWFLTDDQDELRKWRLPAVVLPPGGFLVVFASGKDRAVAGSELHTNFQLGAGGEYLALVRPDGDTVASDFEPLFPPQRPDVSFGIGQRILDDKFVDTGAAGTVHVPSGPGLGLTWTGNPANEPFNDGAAAGWSAATTGIGYSDGVGGAQAPPPIAYWSFDGTGADISGNGAAASINGATFSNDVPARLGVGQSLNFDGADDYVGAELDVSEANHTLSMWFKAETSARGMFTVTVGDLGAGGYDRLLYLNGTNLAARVWNNETITSTGRNYADRQWHHVAHVVSPQVGGQRIYVDGQLVASGAKATSDFDWQERINIGFSNDGAGPYFDGLVDDVAIWDAALDVAAIQALAVGAHPLALTGFDPWIATDIGAAMRGINASAYLRVPFSATLPADFAGLVLRVQYDDGFAAYLNGVEVARRNVPGTLAFNSAAPSERPVAAAIAFEDIDLTDRIGLLRSGRNILALQGLNVGAANADFLLLPELVKVERSPGRYLSPPTPGAPNVYGVLDFAFDVEFSLPRGFYSTAQSVSLSTATQGAQIYYTTNGSAPGPTNAAARLYTSPIAVTRTTLLRAAAFKEELEPSNIVTHTYLFLDNVATQPANPPGYPTSWAGGAPADYAVDSRVVNSALPGYSFRQALLAVPTLSLVCDHDDLFGATRGIYYNTQGRGFAWERQASIELISPEGGPSGRSVFQVNCGIRMHGNSSRDHGFTPKHPIRLLFRREYGAARLRYPVFDDSTVDSFDELLLRGASTDSWPVVDGGPVLGVQRWAAVHATYMRDEYMRKTQLAMGRPSGHGTYVQLYLNGLYWGLYNLAERPGDSFNADTLGGEKEDYDVLKDFAELQAGNLQAWQEMVTLANAGLANETAYQRIQGRNPDGTRNPALPVYLDADNLIDYMILHIASGAEDWPHHNWWAARRRGPESTGFKFFVWDQEISNDSLIRMFTLFQTRFEDPIGDPSPSFFYGRCMQNVGFRLQFMDRVHELLFNDGVLSPARNAERWFGLVEHIDQAIVGESARWGDARRSTPYKREVEWLAEMNFMRDRYWPEIQPIAVGRFRRVGLYPDVAAPSFQVNGLPQHGGSITPGDRLAMLVPSEPRYVDTPIVRSNAPASAFVPANDVLGTRWRVATYVEGSSGESWRRGTNGVGYETGSGYESVISINVAAEMSGAAGNNSVFVRLPFTIPDQATLNALDRLVLRILYDDGFAAYLNGARVAEANAPAEAQLTWNSTATTSTEASLAAPSEFDITAFRGQLRVGPNLLAIHGLNFNNASSDMLILAELIGGVLDETAPAGTIFYTTNGADPMVPGASSYTAPITLAGTVRVQARALDGGEWSALNQAVFVDPRALPLRVTEIMYHPAEPPPGSAFAADEFEFLEILNAGGLPVSLSGIRLGGGVTFDFSTSPVEVLAPGARLLLVENRAAFTERYGAGIAAIAGEYTGKLGNGGEPLILEGPLGEKLLDFLYDDDWYPETDGGGRSLVIVDASAAPESWRERPSWRASLAPGGSPGVSEGEDGGSGGFRLPGDANADGALEISDAIAFLRLVFGDAPVLPCGGAGLEEGGNLALLDLNDDEAVSIADVSFLLAHLFRNGPPPVRGSFCVRIEGCTDDCGP